ncbi:hypothetical protein PFICI_08687 [Pestalotiopsis fici W106-1]|uniref:Uncharacterized protein n=1 Tax=Pestalotiopsis fici (strain W106-1 / CGMCC3.15140) TaxID=1229662 RepID=W3WYI1_PESFW|nr:uncharacterized protein PFICI_08687 [Pestalotiopsis fici W106-1]ETS78834.1 hypothetical protein PFICI_08687 [Pestalotiopsis fici W106-1]
MGDSSTAAQLPRVVILPQRRPKQRRRGFVRAYAPDLMHCGIDQATFLDFIDGLNKAVSSSPLADTFNLSGAAVGAVPASVASFLPLTGMSIQVAASVYTEISSRKGQNSYLLKMNDELLRPRGLYCLVMAYDTNFRRDHMAQDLGPDPVALMLRTATNQSSSVREKIRSNDGVTGASSFPEAAELIFPDLKDDVLTRGESGTDDSEDSESRGSGSSFASRLVERAAAYNARQDLKSQVKFQRKNPTSLINPLLDPSAELGDKDLRKQEKKATKQEKKWEKEDRKAEKRQLKHPEREPRERKIREYV